MVRSQHGITLVEVLAVLTILSFFGVLIWSVFFQGINFSQKEATKNKLQQEANILVTSLTKIHQTSENYQLTSANCETTITFSESTPQKPPIIFKDSQFCYDVQIVNPNSNTVITDFINPNLQDSILTGNIHDKKDPTNRIEIDSLLYRLKGDGG